MRKIILCFGHAMRRFLVPALCMSLCIPMTGCTSESTSKDQDVPALLEPQGIAVQTVTVQRADIWDVSYETVRVFPRSMQLSFAIDGVVDEVLVKRGQLVHKGTVIARLDEEELLESIAELQEQMEELEKQNQKTNAGYEEQIANIKKEIKQLKSYINAASGSAQNEFKAQREIKEIELERVTLEYSNVQEEQAAALMKLEEAYEEKKACVGQNELIAEEDGIVISDLFALLGKEVKKEQVVVDMIDETTLYVQGNYLSEKGFQKLVDSYILLNGQKIPLAYVPLTEEEEKQTTTMIMPGAATVSRTMVFQVAPLEGQVVQNGDYAIKTNVKAHQENVLALPQGIIQKDKLGYYVYKLVDGVRVRTEVIIGLSDRCNVEIISGLEEGDVIYVQY